MRLSDDGQTVILASGRCPFCSELMHFVCEKGEVNEAAKIEGGQVVDILMKVMAHPEPNCPRYEQFLKSGKGPRGLKWLWRKGKFKMDPTPIGEALH